MLTVDTRSLLVHCRRAPYTQSLAKTGIDLAMAAAAFERPVSVLFSGDGVWQLLRDQAPASGEKNHGKLLSALPLYGIESVYVDAASLTTRGLAAEQLCVPVEMVDNEAVAALLARSHWVFNF